VIWSVVYTSFLFITKRKLNKRLICECRCDERLKGKSGGSTRLTYPGFREGLEHLKIETKLINERFPSVMDECVTLTSQPHRYSVDVQNNPFRVIFKRINPRSSTKGTGPVTFLR
jgi:hypothetical protein